jgi:hypothetical protein
MTKLRFTDGMEFDTSGPLRIVYRKDGLYVVGQGMLIPIDSPEEGAELIAKNTGDVVRGDMINKEDQ